MSKQPGTSAFSSIHCTLWLLQEKKKEDALNDRNAVSFSFSFPFSFSVLSPLLNAQNQRANSKQ